MKGRVKTSLGIDISDGRISMALIKKTGGGIKLLRTASAAVPEGAISNGNIENATALAKAIKRLKAKNKMRANHTALSLIVNPLLMQLLDLPEKVPGNIRRFIQDEVKHYAILPIKKIATDFCGIRASLKSTARRAFVVATDSQKLTSVVTALNREGLDIDVVEPAAVAYIRACYEKKIAEKFDKNLLFAIVHQGLLTLCIFRNQTLDFVETKRLEGNILQPDKYFEWLTEEIYLAIQFYELEVLNKRDEWEATVITSVCETRAIDRITSLASNVKGIELDVKTLEDAYLDTPAAHANDGDRPSAVAVGLAMKCFDSCDSGLNVNLFPSEVARVKSAEKQGLILASVTAIFLLFMILGVELLNIKIEKLRDNIERKRQAQVERDMRPLLKEQTLLDKKIVRLKQALSSIDAVWSSESFLRWAQVFDDIASVAPKAVRIKSLSNNGSSKIMLDGSGLSYETVHLFVDTLNSCRDIDSAVLLTTCSLIQ
jgi:Tfp pilus assembly protein PilN